MKNKIIIWTFILLMFLAAIYSFPFLPAEIACQWDSNGNVTNTISKWGIFIPTAISALLVLKNKFLPKNDMNIKRMSDLIYLFVMTILFFAEIYMIFYNTGVKILLDTRYINIISGLFFIAAGNILPKIPQNYLTGIKTVWGFKDGEIWTKTQRLSAKLWVAVGVIMIFSIFLTWDIHGILNLILILTIAIVPYIYGMVLYSKTGNNR